MTTKALKVPQIKMEDKSPFDVGTKNWAPAHGPQLNCQNILFSSAVSATARWAPPSERFDSHLSLLILEERWANLAQLFAFYWDLTRNKFSFLPNAVLTRSLLLIRFSTLEAILDSGRLRRKSFGTLVKIKNNEWNGWKDRKPLGRGPLAISPTAKEVILALFRNYP